MKMKVQLADVIAPMPVATLDPEDCMELGVKENDRIRLVGPKGEMVIFTMSSDEMVKPGTVLLSADALKRIGAADKSEIEVSYSPPPESVRAIRKKMDGGKLDASEIKSVVDDIYEGSLSNIEISAWLTALYINGMVIEEIAEFAKAMVETGERVDFDVGPIFDFHSVGGVPGNKITPIVVSIVAAAGLVIPKTSSRAISSACGTSDFVETFCNIEVGAEQLKNIGESVGGAFVWGGAMNLAPVDDIVINVEHPLGINPRAQMLASIISKKLAINAKNLLIDIPTGAGTKIPTMEVAKAYARDFMDLGEKLGMHVECAITYADQPVGNAIGPNLEARECIRILEGYEHPASVIEKACECAGILLEMGGFNSGAEKAREILKSGKAHEKFIEIVVAQGGRTDLKSSDLMPGEYFAEIISPKSGYVHNILNKEFVAIAKACGSPSDKGAGIVLNKKKGQRVETGDVLFTLYADSSAKLQYAKILAERQNPIVIAGMLIKRVNQAKY